MLADVEDNAERILEYMEGGVQLVSFCLPGAGWLEQVGRIAKDVIPGA